MDTEVAEHEISKKDDFFDDNPIKQNGDVPASLADDVTKEDARIDGEKGSGDHNQVDEASGDNKQDPDAVAASGGGGGDGDHLTPTGEGGAEPAAGNQEEPTDEGFQSTSPPPATESAEPENENQEEKPVAEQEEGKETPAELLPEQDTKESSEPEQDQDKDVGMDDDAAQAASEVEGQSEAQPEGQSELQEEGQTDGQSEDQTEVQAEAQVEGQSQDQAGDESGGPVEGEGDEAAKKEEEEEEKPAENYEVQGGAHDYDDSFSVSSHKSLESIDSTGKTMNPKIEVEKPEAETDGDQQIVNGETDQRSPTPSPMPPSPSPSDSRAEAGAVVPVVVEVDDEQKTDGRSSVEVKENGEYRGEDRTDVNQPEGTEDSRGQGQWQTAEHQYLQSAVLAHKSEQDAMKEVEEERDKLVGENNDMKIKDLQERLAILARENEEKDDHIRHLNDELKQTTIKLKEMERRLAQSEQANAAAANNSEAPKSKTCVIM